MAQTKYNYLIKITFNPIIHIANKITVASAFSIKFIERKCYNDPTYVKTIPANKVDYAKLSDGTYSSDTLIISFLETANFRKAEGKVTLQFDHTKSALYGTLPKDVLQAFNIDFLPVNIDQYQNPSSYDTVKHGILFTDTTAFNKIKTHKEYVSYDTVKYGMSTAQTDVITLIGTIVP